MNEDEKKKQAEHLWEVKRMKRKVVIEHENRNRS